jgi:hypothetical protein
MTPPDVNLRKQKQRHWPVIWGILAAVAIAVLGWVAVVGFADTDRTPTPGDAPADTY